MVHDGGVGYGDVFGVVAVFARGSHDQHQEEGVQHADYRAVYRAGFEYCKFDEASREGVEVVGSELVRVDAEGGRQR